MTHLNRSNAHSNTRITSLELYLLDIKSTPTLLDTHITHKLPNTNSYALELIQTKASRPAGHKARLRILAHESTGLSRVIMKRNLDEKNGLAIGQP